jgi:hypothetical protein
MQKERKNRQVSKVSKKKKKKRKKKRKDSPCFLAIILKFKREKFSRSIVELGLATINILLHTFVCLDLIV